MASEQMRMSRSVTNGWAHNGDESEVCKNAIDPASLCDAMPSLSSLALLTASIDIRRCISETLLANLSANPPSNGLTGSDAFTCCSWFKSPLIATLLSPYACIF